MKNEILELEEPSNVSRNVGFVTSPVFFSIYQQWIVKSCTVHT